ncbi:MAG: hypothetical protein JRJ84_02370 [Deltaproteobacteria bacterium]|nr:hypothetical protein [Deltaproteobacteria bacterium]
MKQGDPTTTAAWQETEPLPDWVLDDPLTRAAGRRGVEPFDITPGAPPVRGKTPRRRRSLLRDASVRRKLFQKAHATPNPVQAPRPRVQELETKPPAHEREFFKPANPLVTNTVVDRPHPVKKDPDPTLEPPPTREMSPGAGTPVEDEFDDDPLNHEWFVDLDGTLEPAQERRVLPPVRVAGFVLGGALLAATMLLMVAVLQGPVSSASPSVPLSVAPAVQELPALLPVEGDEPEVGRAAEDEQVQVPTRFVPAPVRVVSTIAHRSPDDGLPVPHPRPLPIPEAFEPPSDDEPVIEAAPAPQLAEPPEGTAELWSERMPDAGEPANLWGHLDE